MADPKIYSLTEWQFAIKPETTVGTPNTDTMQLVNVDVPITISDNPSIASEIRTKDGRTKKSVDHFATEEGQVKSITISGIADKTNLLILAENCFGIARASNIINLPYNFTGSAFKYGKTSVSDNLHTLTCALVSVIANNTRIYPGCIVDELSWVEEVETDGGRRHFTATFLTRSNPTNDDGTPSSMVAYPSTYYSIWDYTSKILGVSQTATYISDFSSDADGWGRNHADDTLVLTGNEDGIGNPSTDDCLKMYANGGSVNFALKNVNALTTINKVWKMSFDYYADVDCGIAHFGMGTSGDRRKGLDGTYTSNNVDVIEETWQTGQVLEWQVNNLFLRMNGYTTATGQTEDDLLNGKAIYFKNVVLTQIGEVIVSKLEISIKSNVKFYGLGTNGVCEVMDRGLPGFDVSAIIGVKYDYETMSEHLKYPAGTAINLYFADNTVLSSATFGIQSDYSYLTADLNIGNVDEGAFIDIPLEFKASTSGSQLQIAL